MPPNDREKRLESLITLAKELESQLSSTTDVISAGVVSQMEKQIQTFPPRSFMETSKREQADNIGTHLWNICIKLKREGDANGPRVPQIVILMTRIYAYLLLDLTQKSVSEDYANVHRLMKIGLRTAKHCLELKRFDYALKVLEKTATYEDEMKKFDTDAMSEDVKIHNRLISEYFVVRTTLAWHQNQIDLAEHMFQRAVSLRDRLDVQTAENMADSLFEIGDELLRQKQYKQAVKWLRRSHEALTSVDLENLSQDSLELRTSIIQSQVKALIGLEGSDALNTAKDLIDTVESELGDKLIILLMKLEILASPSNDTFDEEKYSSILQKMIRNTVLSESNFKLIMHHIRKLHDKCPSRACKRLDDLLHRVFQAESSHWVPHVLINRLWMTINQRDGGEDQLQDIKTVFDTAASNMGGKPIDESAIHAAQTLIWKRIEGNYAVGLYHLAGDWCRLGLHHMFEHTGDLNKAKLERKLLLCALERDDFDGARQIFGSMSDVAKKEPLTRFLMYKIAIRAEDGDLAAECLEGVYKASTNDATLLYACVVDAQQAGNKSLGIVALQLVLQRYQHAPGIIHIPALLRCTIRMVASQLESNSNDSPMLETMIDQLCTLFECAVTHAQKSHLPVYDSNSPFTVEELQWFSKNAYNIALKYCEQWHSRAVLRMLRSCISCIDVYPQDPSPCQEEDLPLRRVFCHFLATVLLISLARAEANVEIQLQDYLQVRQDVRAFTQTLQNSLPTLEEGPRKDLLAKYSVVLSYDFEAAINLRAWDDLTPIIVEVQRCKCGKVYELLANCLLCSQVPVKVMIHNLKTIVNEAWSLDNFDIAKLARYNRCLFQSALSQESELVTRNLLDQIENFAKQAHESEAPYPVEELEWISTTAFNRAVDFYCAGEDDLCGIWATKAIAIASLVHDGGTLRQLLEAKTSNFTLP